jgi:UDP-GlcNAc3NAcA epimerase
MSRILTIIGTRPQSIKTAAVSHLIREEHGDALEERILYTGQHYDHNLFRVFFDELGIPEPFRNLGVGSGEQGAQTAEMVMGIERALKEETPDLVLLYGDTNSTLAGSLAASKQHIPIAHVESGLRSFRKGMPEEINRVLTDHVSTLLFAPTPTAIHNLSREGFPDGPPAAPTIDRPAVHRPGDVMYDNALRFAPIAERRSKVLERFGLDPGFLLVTFHRAENTQDPERLAGILNGLLELPRQRDRKAIIPLHPGTRTAIADRVDPELWERFRNDPSLMLCDPLPYLDMVRLLRNASLVATDSGGLQKEAFFHGKPCLVLRDETEWAELVENGNSILVGADPERIASGVEGFDEGRRRELPELFGDGKAGSYICRTLRSFLRA